MVKFKLSALVCALVMFAAGSAWGESANAVLCPEPSSILLFLVGMVGLAGYASKRKSVD
ncbi:MAG: PEP-CTERM sorting domain-containing protein [Armatimonadota bacterium]